MNNTMYGQSSESNTVLLPKCLKKNKMRNNHEYKFVYIQLDNRE